MYYAIEIISYGKNRRFTIKAVYPGRGTDPVNGKTYQTEKAARDAAADLGIEITKSGDFYSII